ncbi:hypothetical protein Fmac_001335 [Flemingia macrophylla]|uniref:Beta-defensin n=1 Tax=Flemingia macrophylla TaxID=520843 RepID=A0ABD1NGU2_9FABA
MVGNFCLKFCVLTCFNPYCLLDALESLRLCCLKDTKICEPFLSANFKQS